MKVAILGTRGIPNNYGGFEQFAEYLSLGLVRRGVDVTVYNSDCHPYQEKEWKGVKISHQYDPEKRLGTVGQFIYDLNCVLDCRKTDFDIILQLGYTSSSVWSSIFPKKAIIVTNMDGLEWRRTKYSKGVQTFLKYAEQLAVKYSHHLISDSLGIQKYIRMKYGIDSVYIPYGAEVVKEHDVSVLQELGVTAYAYNILIARLEPENSVELILEGVVKSLQKRPFLVIGNHNTKYGQFLKNKYGGFEDIKFVGSIYDITKLNSIRFFSSIYFHGHTVGGTNPSLLEAMASGALIAAHSNDFNKAILNEDGYYFETSEDIVILLNTVNKVDTINQDRIANNILKVRHTYSWPLIISQYLNVFNLVLNHRLAEAPNNTRKKLISNFKLMR